MRSLFILITLAVILAVAATPCLAAGNNQPVKGDPTASFEAVRDAAADTREVARAAFWRSYRDEFIIGAVALVALAALLLAIYQLGRGAGGAVPVVIYNDGRAQAYGGWSEAVGQQAFDWRYRQSTYYPPPPPPAPGSPPPPPPTP